MLGFDNPIVLVTRPLEGSQAFVKELRKTGRKFEELIFPAFEHESFNPQIPVFDEAIFTSKAGVSFAPSGSGRIAWCVGDATAQAARAAGYDAISAHGNAADLVELILQQKPSSRLLHVRGEITHGNIRDMLNQKGLRCEEVIVYKKVARQEPTDMLVKQLNKRDVILPLFSSETVSIISNWTPIVGRCHIVALSAAVADHVPILQPLSLTTASAPTLTSIVDQTASLIA